jgi:predicted RNA-binding protein with RPS1 domain
LYLKFKNGFRRRPKIGDYPGLNDEHDPKVIQVVSQEKVDLSIRNNTAWTENQAKRDADDISEQLESEFTYEDMVIMSEKFIFFHFYCTTFICMIILHKQ